MGNGWTGQWVCKPRDLELIEERDLRPLVRQNRAWLVKDSRQSVGAFIFQEWTEQEPTVYVREYLMFLEEGIWWQVPRVKIRLIYDTRGTGTIKISWYDVTTLWGHYFPLELRRA